MWELIRAGFKALPKIEKIPIAFSSAEPVVNVVLPRFHPYSYDNKVTPKDSILYIGGAGEKNGKSVGIYSTMISIDDLSVAETVLAIFHQKLDVNFISSQEADEVLPGDLCELSIIVGSPRSNPEAGRILKKLDNSFDHQNFDLDADGASSIKLLGMKESVEKNQRIGYLVWALDPSDSKRAVICFAGNSATTTKRIALYFRHNWASLRPDAENQGVAAILVADSETSRDITVKSKRFFGSFNT
ncbi:MAG: hypothetical protein AAGH88_15990 [Planctomycetota bacterium]